MDQDQQEAQLRAVLVKALADLEAGATPMIVLRGLVDSAMSLWWRWYDDQVRRFA